MTLIADECVALGGIYIKFMQGVLLQHPLMKKWQTSDRYKIFEDVEPENLDIATFLYHHLPGEKRSRIAVIHRTPFAAGSFGQVYMATLRSGQEVVIKILRSHSREALKHDLKMLGYISHLLTGLFTSWDTDMKSIIRDFKRSTLAEIDYAGEKDFAIKVHHEHKDNPYVHIPVTFEDLCTDRMLVQEYVRGVSVAKLVRLKEQDVDIDHYVQTHLGSDINMQLENLGYTMLVSLFEGRPIHGDPHPGNIRLMTDNKVGLIDFGVAANPPKRPKAYFQLMKQQWLSESEGRLDPGTMFRSNMNYYAHDLYQSLKRISRYATEQLHESFDLNQVIGEVAQKLFTEKLTPEQVATFGKEPRSTTKFNDIVNANNRFGLIGRLDDTDMMRSWTTYMSVLGALGKRHLKASLLARVIPKLQQEMPELEQEDTEEVSLSTAVEIVMTWLERVAGRDMRLFQDLMDKLRLRDFFGNNPAVPLPIEEETRYA